MTKPYHQIGNLLPKDRSETESMVEVFIKDCMSNKVPKVEKKVSSKYPSTTERLMNHRDMRSVRPVVWEDGGRMPACY